MNNSIREYRLFRLSIKGKTVLAKVERDNCPRNPLDDSDSAAPVLACWHRRYLLGTDDGPSLVQEQIRNSVNYRHAWEEYTYETPSGGYYENKHWLDFESPVDLCNAAHKCGFLVLPLFLYDHSGITMNTTGYSCRWDSGQVGFIAWSREARQEWHGESWIHDGKQRKEKDLEVMRNIVREYDQYLTGDVFIVTIYDLDGNELQSEGNVFGYEYAVKNALSEAFGADADSVEEIQVDLSTSLAA